MACSEARTAANRANALKSTGPKTDGGKAASRRNALKHGLTGAGVVVPGEDAAEVARESAAFLAELAPEGLPTARLLAERVATLAVRLKRSARHEFAATAERAHRAAADFEDARVAEAERLFGAIDEGTNRDDLLAMPEGVDLLDAALAELRETAVRAADDPAGWSRDDSARLTRCLSRDVRDHGEAPGRASIDGDLGGLDAIGDRDNLRGPWAPDRVIGLVDAERARLGSTRSGLDLEALARARDEAVALALVDDDPATLLARKYEAATERSLYRALREIRATREPAPAAEVSPPSVPSPVDLARAAEAGRRQFAGAESAPVAAAIPPVGSFFPGVLDPSGSGHGSTTIDVGPAPHGRSRFDDRRKRPKLGR